MGNKSLLSEFLRKWGGFEGHNETFPKKILAKNQNLKKQRHGFAYERTLITTALISSCHRETIVTLYQKSWKRIFNTNSELSQNRTEYKIKLLNTSVN